MLIGIHAAALESTLLHTCRNDSAHYFYDVPLSDSDVAAYKKQDRHVTLYS